MKQKAEQEIKILDVFYFPNKTIMAVIDCQIEPVTGDYLIDKEDNLVWKIDGVVLHTKEDINLKPVHYLNNKNYKRSVSLKPIMERDTKLNIGDSYFLKKPPVIV